MDNAENIRPWTALEINLARTKSVVEIPDQYEVLREVVRNRPRVLKRTEEVLVELHHPFVNWGYLLEQLKALSIGNFNEFNTHEQGFPALESLADIYMIVITSAGDEEIKDNAVRYLLEHGSVPVYLPIPRRSVSGAGPAVEKGIGLCEGRGQIDG
jgi:pyruvate,orthophosphate dikinase